MDLCITCWVKNASKFQIFPSFLSFSNLKRHEIHHLSFPKIDDRFESSLPQWLRPGEFTAQEKPRRKDNGRRLTRGKSWTFSHWAFFFWGGGSVFLVFCFPLSDFFLEKWIWGFGSCFYTEAGRLSVLWQGPTRSSERAVRWKAKEKVMIKEKEMKKAKAVVMWHPQCQSSSFLACLACGGDVDRWVEVWLSFVAFGRDTQKVLAGKQLGTIGLAVFGRTDGSFWPRSLEACPQMENSSVCGPFFQAPPINPCVNQ